MDKSLGEGRSLTQLGSIAWRQSEYENAKTWYHAALALLPTAETPEAAKALTQALNGLGTIHRQQGDFAEAQACYEQALAVSRQNFDRLVEARTLNNLGALAGYQQHYAQALAYHQAALAIRRAIGHRTGEGISLGNLAIITREMGDYAQAREYLTATLTVHQATGNRYDEAAIWNELGIFYQELGDWSQAQTCLERGLELCERIGYEAAKGYILANLGLVMLDLDEPGRAESYFAQGRVLAEEHNNRPLISGFLSYLAQASLQLQHYPAALEHAQAALAIRSELKLAYAIDDLATLTAIYLAQQDQPAALNYAQQTLTRLAECGGDGPEFPQRAYFICYQALAAAGEPAANATLQAAHQLVLKRADKIAEATLRQSFLERVPVNRAIVEAVCNPA